MPSYFSNGKLLITGEYLVMHGAISLCVPLKSGQKIIIEEKTNGKPAIRWKSLYRNKQWFSLTLSLPNLQIITSSEEKRALFLRNILKKAHELNPGLLDANTGLQITSKLDFDPDWGWGSSSSLISNIAYWAGIDPFKLFFSTQNGSGYDIACARASGPLLYQRINNRPEFKRVEFNPPFVRKLYLVYLGKKQDTSSSISQFSKSAKYEQTNIERISSLTSLIYKATKLDEFHQAMREHESMLSKLLGLEPVKARYFPDFKGEMKSLGAWGGDFILVSSESDKKEVINYFKSKGFNIIFNFNEVVKNDAS